MKTGKKIIAVATVGAVITAVVAKVKSNRK